VQDILRYRQLTKLKSTYVDGLYPCIRDDGKIHSRFNQTVTATGRLSSSDPNLQNIPIRTELGRQLRRAFVPSDDSFVFTDADYSQIELRLLASMSGDEKLIEAYRSGEDIHRLTASQVLGIPPEKITAAERSSAKAVNFGIIYGISAFALSDDLHISQKQAKEYIEKYYRQYPQIRDYLEGCVTQAKEKGYGVTLFGRRRVIDELKSSNFAMRGFGERVAKNMPIQGTAADIMKIAMIRVFKALKEQNLESRLLLTVHDELLIETKRGEEEQVAAILREGMTGAADLAVPLTIEIQTGADWYHAK
jgi:DNA polymerase-1